MRWLVIEYEYGDDNQIIGTHRVSGPFDSHEDAILYKMDNLCHDIIGLEPPL